MKHIDKLFLKASKLRPQYNDVCIISNASGQWKIGEMEFPTLEAAERNALDGYAGAADDLLIIINDAGPGYERESKVSENDRVEIKDKDTHRSKKDTYPGNEHGGKRKDGHQKGEYRHSWV